MVLAIAAVFAFLVLASKHMSLSKSWPSTGMSIYTNKHLSWRYSTNKIYRLGDTMLRLTLECGITLLTKTLEVEKSH